MYRSDIRQTVHVELDCILNSGTVLTVLSASAMLSWLSPIMSADNQGPSLATLAMATWQRIKLPQPLPTNCKVWSMT